MPRRPRLAPVGVPQHIIQRGNNRQVCFGCHDDMAAYASWLREGAKKYQVRVHAWVFMTNHVHLLCTPDEEGAVSKLMQFVGRHYVRYFNAVYGRSGTLWEGRFKSCLVQEEEYLFHCYRYIELNPVRANMVRHPGEYVWSSYHSNAAGVASKLITPHEEYLRLGKTALEREAAYRGMFDSHLDAGFVKDIQQATSKCLVLGNDKFKDEIELLTGSRVKELRRGPKVKNGVCGMDG